ncbi:hypothetical protein GCM10027091_62300 [Streptomyces daliensis]
MRSPYGPNAATRSRRTGAAGPVADGAPADAAAVAGAEDGHGACGGPARPVPPGGTCTGAG